MKHTKAKITHRKVKPRSMRDLDRLDARRRLPDGDLDNRDQDQYLDDQTDGDSISGDDTGAVSIPLLISLVVLVALSADFALTVYRHHSIGTALAAFGGGIIVVGMAMYSPDQIRSWFATIRDRIRFCFTCMARYFGLHLIPTRHRRRIHLAILGVIAWDLITVGMKVADFGFLMLSFMLEAEGIKDQHVDQPATNQHHVWRHESPTTIEQQTHDILKTMPPIPRASAYLYRLQSWAEDVLKVVIVPWHPAKRDAGASAWTDRSGGHYRISISDQITDPSIRLYLLLHEVAHVLSRVRADVDAHRKPADTCWALQIGNVDQHVRILIMLSKDPHSTLWDYAGEYNSEHTVLHVFNLMRWDPSPALAYLSNWHAESSDIPCLLTDARRNAERIVSALTDAQDPHAS